MYICTDFQVQKNLIKIFMILLLIKLPPSLVHWFNTTMHERVFLGIIGINKDKKDILYGKQLLAKNSNFVSGEHETRRGGTTKSAVKRLLLIQRLFVQFLSMNISWTRRNMWSKIWILYQENMRLEEVARQSRSLSGCSWYMDFSFKL